MHPWAHPFIVAAGGGGHLATREWGFDRWT